MTKAASAISPCATAPPVAITTSDAGGGGRGEALLGVWLKQSGKCGQIKLALGQVHTSFPKNKWNPNTNRCDLAAKSCLARHERVCFGQHWQVEDHFVGTKNHLYQNPCSQKHRKGWQLWANPCIKCSGWGRWGPAAENRVQNLTILQAAFGTST